MHIQNTKLIIMLNESNLLFNWIVCIYKKRIVKDSLVNLYQNVKPSKFYFALNKEKQNYKRKKVQLFSMKKKKYIYANYKWY